MKWQDVVQSRYERRYYFLFWSCQVLNCIGYSFYFLKKTNISNILAYAKRQELARTYGEEWFWYSWSDQSNTYEHIQQSSWSSSFYSFFQQNPGVKTCYFYETVELIIYWSFRHENLYMENQSLDITWNRYLIDFPLTRWITGNCVQVFTAGLSKFPESL